MKDICFWGAGDYQEEHFTEIPCPPHACQPNQFAELKRTVRSWHLRKRTTTEVPNHPQSSLKQTGQGLAPLRSCAQIHKGYYSKYRFLPLICSWSPRFKAPAPCPPLHGKVTPSPVERGDHNAGERQQALDVPAKTARLWERGLWETLPFIWDSVHKLLRKFSLQKQKRS